MIKRHSEGGEDPMNNMARRREAAGLTQGRVADLLGMERSGVAKWETGVALPRADKLPILAKLYGCTIDELFEGHRTDEKNHEDS